MFDRGNHAERLQMLVAEDVAAVQYSATRNANFTKSAHDLKFVVLARPRGDDVKQLIKVVRARAWIAETRVGEDIRSSNRGDEIFPHLFRGCDDIGVIVRAAGGAGIEISGCKACHAIAAALRRHI